MSLKLANLSRVLKDLLKPQMLTLLGLAVLTGKKKTPDKCEQFSDSVYIKIK